MLLSARDGLPGYSKSSCSRVLLTNGHLPVALGLARQLRRAGHTVYVVDPMRSHLCKFSSAVRKCKQVPSPHDEPQNYIRAVKDLVKKWRINLIIPVDDDTFYLADSEEPEIIQRLFAPPLELLVRLHDKWEFNKLAKRCRMDVPDAYLCKNLEDVEKLDLSKYKHGLTLTPCLGTTGAVYHLKDGEPLPEDVDIGEHNWHIAQERVKGVRYCSYSVVTQGKVMATGLYPALEPIDSLSSVYFQQKHYVGMHNYIETFVSQLGKFDAQLAFDFMEIGDRLVAMACYPKSTSGIRLWTNSSKLARAMTNSLPAGIKLPISPPKDRTALAQATPVMMRWEHKDAGFFTYARHMEHLVGAKDGIWKTRDMLPSLAQPFLLTKYYRMCNESGLQFQDFFQMHTLWQPMWDSNDPHGCQLGDIRKLMIRSDEKEEVKLLRNSGIRRSRASESSSAFSRASTLYERESFSMSKESQQGRQSPKARGKRVSVASERSREFPTAVTRPVAVC